MIETLIAITGLLIGAVIVYFICQRKANTLTAEKSQLASDLAVKLSELQQMTTRLTEERDEHNRHVAEVNTRYEQQIEGINSRHDKQIEEENERTQKLVDEMNARHRVGEDEVELLTAALHETEHIATDGKDGRGTVRSIRRATISSAPHIHRWRAGMRLTGHQLGDALLDETVMVAVGLDTHHLPFS